MERHDRRTGRRRLHRPTAAVRPGPLGKRASMANSPASALRRSPATAASVDAARRTHHDELRGRHRWSSQLGRVRPGRGARRGHGGSAHRPPARTCPARRRRPPSRAGRRRPRCGCPVARRPSRRASLGREDAAACRRRHHQRRQPVPAARAAGGSCRPAPTTSCAFHEPHADGPVAIASASVSACNNSSVLVSPTASATSRVVAGSVRSRRTAISGRRRWCGRAAPAWRRRRAGDRAVARSRPSARRPRRVVARVALAEVVEQGAEDEQVGPGTRSVSGRRWPPPPTGAGRR